MRACAYRGFPVPPQKIVLRHSAEKVRRVLPPCSDSSGVPASIRIAEKIQEGKPLTREKASGLCEKASPGVDFLRFASIQHVALGSSPRRSELLAYHSTSADYKNPPPPKAATFQRVTTLQLSENVISFTSYADSHSKPGLTFNPELLTPSRLFPPCHL